MLGLVIGAENTFVDIGKQGPKRVAINAQNMLHATANKILREGANARNTIKNNRIDTYAATHKDNID